MLLVLGARSKVHDGLVCMQPELPMLVRAMKHGVEDIVSRQIAAPPHHMSSMETCYCFHLLGVFLLECLLTRCFHGVEFLEAVKLKNTCVDQNQGLHRH